MSLCAAAEACMRALIGSEVRMHLVHLVLTVRSVSIPWLRELASFPVPGGNVPGPPCFSVLQVMKSWAWDWERG